MTPPDWPRASRFVRGNVILIGVAAGLFLLVGIGAGEPRGAGLRNAFGDRPPLWRTLLDLLTLSAVAVGLLCLAGYAVSSLWRRRGVRPSPPSPKVDDYGPVISTHRSTFGYTPVLVSELLLLAAAAGVFQAVLWPGPAKAAGAILAVTGGAAALAYAVQFVLSVRRAGTTIALVCRDGLVVWQGGPVLVSSWAMARFVGIPHAEQTSFRVRAASGDEYRFTAASWPEFARLRQACHDAISTEAWPQRVEELHTQGELEFGRFRVTPSGISNGRSWLAWNEVERTEFAEDQTEAYLGSSKLWLDLKIKLAETPDAGLLLFLIDELRNQARGEYDQWALDEQDNVARQAKRAMPAMVLLAVGITVLLCGGLGIIVELTGRVRDTMDTAVTLVSAGAALGAAGFLWLWAAYRRTRYRIAHPYSPVMPIVALAALITVVGIPFGLAAALDIAGIRIAAGPLTVVLIGVMASVYFRLRTALVVTAGGMSIGGTSLPWQYIEQIVVSGLDGGGGAEVGARLRAGVRLPPEVTLPDPDPDDPHAPQARVVISRRKLDLPGFVAAIDRLGPPGIPIIERTKTGERVIRRNPPA